MSKQVPPFGLRLPRDVRAALETSAKANKRSLNAEILARLQQTLDAQDVGYDCSNRDPVAATLRALEGIRDLSRTIQNAVIASQTTNGQAGLVLQDGDPPEGRSAVRLASAEEREILAYVRGMNDEKRQRLLRLLDRGEL